MPRAHRQRRCRHWSNRYRFGHGPSWLSQPGAPRRTPPRHRRETPGRPSPPPPPPRPERRCSTPPPPPRPPPPSARRPPRPHPPRRPPPPRRAPAVEEHVAEVVIAVDENRRPGAWLPLEQPLRQLGCPPGELGGGAVHQPGPARDLGSERHRLLIADAGFRRGHGLETAEHLHGGGCQPERVAPGGDGRLDSIPVDHFHEDEWSSVDDRVV